MVCITMLLLFKVQAQKPINSLKMDSLQYGKWGVGFKDTVIFDEIDDYVINNQKFKKPIWIQIWYPSKQKVKKPMLFNEYTKLPSTFSDRLLSSIFESITLFLPYSSI